MSINTKVLLVILSIAASTQVWAQGPRRGGDPSRMIQREKVMMFEQITDLTEKQKLTISELYNDLAQKVDQQMAKTEADIRKKRETFRKDKNQAVKNVLTEAQIKEYDEFMANRPKLGKHFRKERRD